MASASPENKDASLLSTKNILIAAACMVAAAILIGEAIRRSGTPESETQATASNRNEDVWRTVAPAPSQEISSQEARAPAPDAVRPKSNSVVLSGTKLGDGKGGVKNDQMRVAVMTPGGEVEYVPPDDPRAIQARRDGSDPNTDSTYDVPERPSDLLTERTATAVD